MKPPAPRTPFTPLADRLCRSGYWVAYRLMKAWWFVRRPHHHGACAAVWQSSRILLVRCSYRPWTVLPGGFAARGERLVLAAARELAEEVGLHLDPTDFRPAGVYEHCSDHLRDHVHIFEARLAAVPALTIDRREIVWAGFVEVEEALAMNLLPPVRAYLEAQASGAEVSRPVPANAASPPQSHASSGLAAHPPAP